MFQFGIESEQISIVENLLPKIDETLTRDVIVVGQCEGFESMHFNYVQAVTKSELLSVLCLASHLHYPPRILEIPISLH